MGVRDAHLRQARANRDHAEWLLQAKPGDATAMQWAVTASFYCALHCIEAHFAPANVHSSSHRDRLDNLVNPILAVRPEVSEAYLKLQERSEAARYGMEPFNARQVEKLLRRTLPVVTGLVDL